jgi:hypothetical protein
VKALATLKTICPRCKRPTHPDELTWLAALGWVCLRCVEDARPEMEGR